MLGQAHHFRIYAPEKINYAIDRYTNEAHRLYGVIEQQLSRFAYVAGDEYTLADIAIYPWICSWKNQGINLADFPQLHHWFESLGRRPAVQRGMAVLTELRRPLTDSSAKEALFGAQQYQRR